MFSHILNFNRLSAMAFGQGKLLQVITRHSPIATITTVATRTTPPLTQVKPVARSAHFIRMMTSLCKGEENLVNIPVTTFEEVIDLIKNPKRNTFIIDVRQPSEFTHGNIPTSKLVPLDQIPKAFGLSGSLFKDMYGFTKPNHDSHIVFLCHKGIRAHVACELAKRMGYRSVSNYKGSWMEWESRSKTNPSE